MSTLPSIITKKQQKGLDSRHTQNTNGSPIKGIVKRKNKWIIAEGYPAIGCGEDVVFEDRVIKHGVEIQPLENNLSDILNRHRWDTDSLHLSGWGMD